MRGRQCLPSLWIGWLTIHVMAGSALALDVSTAGAQSTQGSQREVPCASLSESERLKTERCLTDEERIKAEQEKRQREAQQREKATHSSFLRWVHVDALWIPAASGNQTFGLVGTHLAVANVGRIYFYGPPGVILLRQPNGHGWSYRPGFSWGFSVYLTEAKVPGTTHHARLFFNLTKVWTQGDYRTGMDMAGLSVTWKK
jgi:hypothetical protein